MEGLGEADRNILRDLLTSLQGGTTLPTRAAFRVRHERARDKIDRLLQDGYLVILAADRIALSLAGARACDSDAAATAFERARALLDLVKEAYRRQPGHVWSAGELGSQFGISAEEVQRIGTLLFDLPVWSAVNFDPRTGFVASFQPTERILDTPAPDWSTALTRAKGAVRGALSHFRIEAYRGLRDVELVKPARMNLIIGSNNSGKSSLLEAIGLLARPFDPAQWAQTAHSRENGGSLVDGVWGMFPASAALLPEGDQSLAMNLASEDERLQVQATLSTTDDWPYSEHAEDVEDYVAVSLRVHHSSAHGVGSIKFDSRGRTQRQTPAWPGRVAFFVTPLTHRSNHQLNQHLSATTLKGEKAELLEILREFDRNVKDVEETQHLGRQMIVVTHHKRGVVPLSSFGDGMRRAFAIAAALQRARGGILLIDELEAGIHRHALEPVLTWMVDAAVRADVQIFATTHSLETVDAALAATVSRADVAAGYRLRRAEGQVTALRYDREGIERLRDEGLDIR